MHDQRVATAQAHIDRVSDMGDLAEKAREILFDEYVDMFKHEIAHRRTDNIVCLFDDLGLDYMELIEARLAMIRQEFLTYESDDLIMTMLLSENDLNKIKCAVKDIIDMSPKFEDKVADYVTKAISGDIELGE